MKYRRFAGLLPIAILSMVFRGIPASAQPLAGGEYRLAVIGFENSGGDPRLDYLASLSEGILRYDLSVLAGIPLVERRSLDKLLSEQELSLAGITDPKTAARAGSLAGASHLVLGDYAVVAGELALTVHLVDAATGTAVTFRDRGVSEHVVHRIAEKLASRLLERRSFVFADASNDRSLLSLRDETPGIITLYSPIRAAEIYLDGEFVGYTKGDGLEPLLLESVRPGKRTIRVHLGGGDFGVVQLPQVEFKDWEAVIDVRPGGRHAVRDQTRHFNEVLYRLEHLDSVERKAPRGSAASLAVSRELSFEDRTGKTVAVSFSATPAENASGVSLTLSLKAGGIAASGAVAYPERPGMPAKARIVAGIVAMEVEISASGDSYEVDVDIRRTDVYQGMHKER